MNSDPYTSAPFRQILFNVGNRYVVFAARQSLPVQPAFSPADIERRLPRVPEGTEPNEKRTIESLRVSDASVTEQRRPHEADFTIIDRRGNRTAVELKVRDRAMKKSDIDTITSQLQSYPKKASEKLEVWYLDIDSLTLDVVWHDDRGTWRSVDLHPVDVWEYGSDGQPFLRTSVEREVREWVHNIAQLYAKIQSWTSQSGLRTEQVRTITMSEELMNLFAVPDRELPVLDVLRGEEPILSFVPHGLWIIGAHGRIDIISRSGMRVLVNAAREGEPNWLLVEPANRTKPTSFDESAYLMLVGAT